MKKNARLMALLAAGLMTVTLCSCGGNSAPTASNDSGSIAAQEKSDPSESEVTKELEVQPSGTFSDSTLGSFFQLASDVLGKDLATAEGMIGGFFNVELKDLTGSMVTTERKEIVNTIHTYAQILSKDSVRFNGMEIWTDQEDGRVRRISLTCTNSSYTTEFIEDTPEFRDEIKKLNDALNDEMKSAMGDPFETGDLVGDADSIYHYYKVSDDCLANIEIRDFTSPDENDLLSTKIIFADCDILLF